jgi:hypothetical protein
MSKVYVFKGNVGIQVEAAQKEERLLYSFKGLSGYVERHCYW